MTDHAHDTQAVTDAIHAPTDADWSIDDILDQARLPEEVARFCIRPDLQAEYDTLLADLRLLVTATGEPIADPDEELAAGDTAQAKATRLRHVELEMRSAMRSVRFRGLDGEELVKFEAKHRPGKTDADEANYWLLLIAETAISPTMTITQVQEFRRKLGHGAYKELLGAAQRASYRGGVSVPKSPTSLLNLAQP